MAENLIGKTMPLPEIEEIMGMVDDHGGHEAGGGRSCEERLAALLLDILDPFDRMGAVIAEGTGKRLDLRHVRMFFMGVLGWSPATVMDEADLNDLADAFEGYARFHGMRQDHPAAPSADFLTGMLNKFPDKEGDGR